MDELNDAFFQKLADKLKTLPSWSEPVKREDKWMTPEQIQQWTGTKHTPGEIEKALMERWLNNTLGNIRPAKHPHENKMVSLWGHVDRTWAFSEASINLNRLDEPAELEKLDLPEDAPMILVSFSMPDLELALELRRELAQKGFNAWLFIHQIKTGDIIINKVHTGIEDSICAMGLITRVSIGSAWVYSELLSVKNQGKFVYTLFDDSDPDLMQLLESWSPEQDPPFNHEYIEPMVKSYMKTGIEHNIDGYKTGIENLLKFLSSNSRQVFFKKRPEGWKGNKGIIDFGTLMNDLNPGKQSDNMY